MTELLTAAQMRAIEQAAIDSGEVTGLDLMERAGRGVVDAIMEEWPELATTSHRAVILCGPGNNGGDGFVVARLLKERGWEVEVFLYGDVEKLPPDAKANAERWKEFGPTQSIDEGTIFGRFAGLTDETHPDLWLDALFGTGLARPISGAACKALSGVSMAFSELVSSSGGRVVAVDMPSGLDSDSGKSLVDAQEGFYASGVPRHAELTVTFHRQKVGHYLDSGSRLCGSIVIADIGLNNHTSGASAPVRPRPAPQGGGEVAPTLRPGANLVTLVDPIYHRLSKTDALGRDTHKYTHGHALILSGPPGATGAARLAARGALRIGAGLVTLGVPPAAQLECAAQLTAIMLTRTPDAEALADILQDDRINALCLGPGFGTGDREAAILATALGRRAEARPTDDAPVGRAEARHRSTILDADALTLLANHPDLFAALHDNCVLTPHAGEFKRLFPDIAEKLSAPATTGPAYSKVDATRDAAARAGCTILFKGPDTVIADPSGRCAINASAYDRAAPWLATAGAGDVLAGFIAGLLARGFEPMQAAETAGWLHTECALSFGPGLIAEDLPEELPKVLQGLGV